MEIPDAIGWAKLDSKDKGLISYLIECKTSRRDFRDNHKKNAAMGQFRYFLAPKGLLKPGDMYNGWGLLQWDGKTVRVSKKATFRGKCGIERENYVLVSVLRRTLGSLRDITQLCNDQPLSVRFTSHFEDAEWDDGDTADDGIGYEPLSQKSPKSYGIKASEVKE